MLDDLGGFHFSVKTDRLLVLEKWLNSVWYATNPVGIVLAPLSVVFRVAMTVRRWMYTRGLLKRIQVSRPVVVVGNLTTGGTGKTPIVIWLVEAFKEQGLRPGVVCSGYGGRSKLWPLQVDAGSDPREVGDEAVLIARRTGVPVAAGPDRVVAARGLCAMGLDVVVSDDGLQHYRMRRQVEIAVVDGERGFGNGRLLPAGPLREPVTRLQTVDLVVSNGPLRDGNIGVEAIEFNLLIDEARAVRGDGRKPLTGFAGQTVHAVAGIGHPERFFSALEQLAIKVIRHPRPDHAALNAADIEFDDDRPVLMTEKDAVKCADFADARHWYVPASASFAAGTREILRAAIAAGMNKAN